MMGFTCVTWSMRFWSASIRPLCLAVTPTGLTRFKILTKLALAIDLERGAAGHRNAMFGLTDVVAIDRVEKSYLFSRWLPPQEAFCVRFITIFAAPATAPPELRPLLSYT